MDIRVTVFDGSYHVVDSSELAFKIAGSMGFKKVDGTGSSRSAGTAYEPWTLRYQRTAIGAVLGDLNARRGRIVMVTPTDIWRPSRPGASAEMLTYAPSLTSYYRWTGNIC